MKKLIFLVIIFFTSVGVKALEPTLYYQDNIYSNRIGAEDKIWSGKMAFIFMNDQIVYCLDPYLIVGHNYEVNQSYSISKEDLEYYSLVSYFGYNKTNRSSIYYYMAAQELIWERIIGKGKVFWTTGQYNTGSSIDISNYKKEIEDDINNFNLLPEVSYIYLLSSFEKLNIIDNNKVLNKYQVNVNGESIVEQDNNSIDITMYDKEKTEIVLERNISNNIPSKIYQAGGSQTLGQFGTNITRQAKINILLDHYQTNLYLNFYDEDTKEKIEDISFNICDNDLEIVKNTKGFQINKIQEGEYKLCNISDPYSNNDKAFKIDVNDYQEETYIDIYLKKDKIEEEIVELPNTYNNEIYIYGIIFLILIGSIIYEVR